MTSSKKPSSISQKTFLQINSLLEFDNIVETIDYKKITRNTLAKRSNTRVEVIDKWYDNKVEKMDLDVLARICYVLNCSPSDILKYNNPDTM